MFAHAHPLASEAVRAAYVRRIDRLMGVVESARPLCLVSTVLIEPAKRPGWANGFTREFPRPTAAGLDEHCRSFGELVSRRAGKTFYVTIRQKTEQAERKLLVLEDTSEALSLELQGQGANNGRNFTDPDDDALCRRLYSTLFGHDHSGSPDGNVTQ